MCIAEQHEQDMLEELDRMHEECQALREDSKAGVHVFLSSPASCPATATNRLHHMLDNAYSFTFAEHPSEQLGDQTAHSLVGGRLQDLDAFS